MQQSQWFMESDLEFSRRFSLRARKYYLKVEPYNSMVIWLAKYFYSPERGKCFYCGKRLLWRWQKRWPIHPKDGDSRKFVSCDECWQNKVAGIGLTTATGDKKVDSAKIAVYFQNARECFKLGKYEEALENVSYAEELALKCLGFDLGLPAAHLRGDCYWKVGCREDAVRNLELALELVKKGKSVGSATPWGVAYTVTKSISKGIKVADLEMKIGRIRAEPLVEEILKTYKLEKLEELRMGLKRRKEKYHLYTPEKLAKDSAEFQIREGFNSIVNGRYEEAIQILEKAATIHSNNPAIYYWLGIAHFNCYYNMKGKSRLAKIISRVSPEELSETKAKAKESFEKVITTASNRDLITEAKRWKDKLTAL